MPKRWWAMLRNKDLLTDLGNAGAKPDREGPVPERALQLTGCA